MTALGLSSRELVGGIAGTARIGRKRGGEVGDPQDGDR
jgi:hypothetical protein